MQKTLYVLTEAKHQFRHFFEFFGSYVSKISCPRNEAMSRKKHPVTFLCHFHVWLSFVETLPSIKHWGHKNVNIVDIVHLFNV